MANLLFANHVLGIHGNYLLPASQFNPDPDPPPADTDYFPLLGNPAIALRVFRNIPFSNLEPSGAFATRTDRLTVWGDT